MRYRTADKIGMGVMLCIGLVVVVLFYLAIKEFLNS